MKKILSILLILSMFVVCASVSSCSKQKDNTSTSSTSLTSTTEPTPPEERLPTIAVSDATVVPGDKNVVITVALKNNPGITSMMIKIIFDNTALELSSMTYNTEAIGGTTVPNVSSASPVTAYWVDGFKNVTGDFTFVTLTFNVLETASAGEYNISVQYNVEDIFDVNERNVEFVVKNGTITIS